MPSGIYIRKKIKKIETRCDYCKKNIIFYPSNKSKLHFCNKKCSGLFRRGIEFSKKHKQNLSLALKGRKFSKKHKQNISLAQNGRKMSKKTRRKIADSNRKYHTIKEKREAKKRRKIKTQQKYPEKIKAQRIAQKKIKIPQNQLCEKCNKSLAIHRHHPDYSKPLKIVFVCLKCHWKIHHNKI